MTVLANIYITIGFAILFNLGGRAIYKRWGNTVRWLYYALLLIAAGVELLALS